MEVLTKDYGKIEINATSIIHFENGIIGFKDHRDYVLLDCGDVKTSPIRCLQSIDESGLAFTLLDPYAVRPDYEVAVDDEAVESLSLEADDDIVILAIVVVPDDIKMMSVNLKAPIIINARVNKGIQYIVDSPEYGVRHLLADEAERTKSIRLCKNQPAV